MTALNSMALRAAWRRSRREIASALALVLPRSVSAWRARRAREERRRDLERLRRQDDAARAGGGLEQTTGPFSVHHELTSRCNLACGMCYQSDWRAAAPRLELDQAALHRLHERLHPRRAVLVGSEVMLHPRFYEIAEDLARDGCELHLITNGTLLDEERAPRLLALQSLRSVIVSIDGPEDVHDSIRGGRAAFARTIRALGLLRGKVECAVHCVLQAANLATAHEVLDIAHAQGVSSVHYGFLYAYTQAEIDETHAILERELGWPRSEVELAVTAGDGVGFDAPALRACIERIEARARQLGMHPSFAPAEFREHIEAYVEGTLHETHRMACRDLLEPSDLRIDPRGKLVPCAVIKKDLGDPALVDPVQLANHEERRNFAKLVRDRNLLPICRRCCRATLLSKHA